MTVQPSPAAATPESSTPVARLRPLSLRIRALAENPARGVMRLGLGLIALQLAVRLVMALRGWFVGDDYAFIARAWEHPSPDLDLLSLAYAGHVMPLGWLWIWVCTHLAPYNFMVPTLMSTLVQALTGVVVLRLLIALFGRRWAVLVPFTLYLFSTISVPAYVWWAAAINQQPQALAMAGVLLNHVQYLRTGRARRAAALTCTSSVPGKAPTARSISQTQAAQRKPSIRRITSRRSSPRSRTTWRASSGRDHALNVRPPSGRAGARGAGALRSR